MIYTRSKVEGPSLNEALRWKHRQVALISYPKPVLFRVLWQVLVLCVFIVFGGVMKMSVYVNS